MSTENQQNIAFYQGTALQSVLKRFEFSEDEKELIYSAIRTSKSSKPRMALIHQADALLKEVAKTREPIIPKSKSEVSAEALAKIELMKFSTASRQEKLDPQEKSRSFFGFRSKYGILTVIIITLGIIAGQYLIVKPRNDSVQHMENLAHGKR